MNIEERQSLVFKTIRFPFIVLVVFIHALPVTSKVSLDLNHSGIKIYYLITEAIRSDIASIAVPGFFFISGYYFFVKTNSYHFRFYKKQFAKRLKTLLIPYFLWNLLTVIIFTLKEYSSYFIGYHFVPNNSLSMNDSFISLFWANPEVHNYPIDFPLWFLRDLMCMILISPLFYVLFKYTKIYGLLILFALYLLQVDSMVPGFSPTAIFYFGIGAFLGIEKKNVLEVFNTHKYFSASLFLLLLLVFSYLRLINCQLFNNLHGLLCLFGFILFVNMMNALVDKKTIAKILSYLSTSVFFIYAVHSIYIIGIIRGFFYKTFLSQSWWGLILSYFLIAFSCTAICLLLYYCLQKMFPRILSILVGGRR